MTYASRSVDRSLLINEVAVEIVVTCPTPPRIVAHCDSRASRATPGLRHAVAIEYPTEDAEEAHRLALQKALAEGGNGE